MNVIPGISETVRHMQAHPEQVLLPEHYEDSCRINSLGERLIISFLFNTVYLHKIEHSTSIRKPMCDYIVDNYEMADSPDEKNFGYGLWVRKSAQPLVQKPDLAETEDAALCAAEPVGAVFRC